MLTLLSISVGLMQHELVCIWFLLPFTRFVLVCCSVNTICCYAISLARMLLSVVIPASQWSDRIQVHVCSVCALWCSIITHLVWVFLALLCPSTSLRFRGWRQFMKLFVVIGTFCVGQEMSSVWFWPGSVASQCIRPIVWPTLEFNVFM